MSKLWQDEILRAYTEATVFGRGYYYLPPLTRWQRVKRWFKFYEARHRLRNAWICLRHGAELE